MLNFLIYVCVTAKVRIPIFYCRNFKIMLYINISDKSKFLLKGN